MRKENAGRLNERRGLDCSEEMNGIHGTKNRRQGRDMNMFNEAA